MADYVSLYTYQNDVSVSFAVEDPKIMALGEKLKALCPDAYMNGYNWDVLFRYYLEHTSPMSWRAWTRTRRRVPAWFTGPSRRRTRPGRGALRKSSAP